MPARMWSPGRGHQEGDARLWLPWYRQPGCGRHLYSVFNLYSVMYLLHSYFRICTQFSITGTQLCNYFCTFRIQDSEFVLDFPYSIFFFHYEVIIYKCQSLYSVFHLWYIVLQLIHSYFRICIWFSRTQFDEVIIYKCQNMYAVFDLWYSVMKLVRSDFIICYQFSIIVFFKLSDSDYRFVLGFKALILGYYATIIYMIPEFILDFSLL